jgi:hypothetical protein
MHSDEKKEWIFLTSEKVGWNTLVQDKPWPTPVSVHDASFDFESAVALSIETEEMFGYLDSGEIGRGLFSDSPLTTPEPTPPPSPTQKSISLDDHNPLPFPPDPQSVAGKTASTSSGRLGKVENADKKYGSNKKLSHAKRKCDRAEQRKEREAGVHPYEVRPAEIVQMNATALLGHVYTFTALAIPTSHGNFKLTRKWAKLFQVLLPHFCLRYCS